MEQNQIINDALESEGHLEHHGIKGMKWGVWNEETRLKYLGAPPKYGEDPDFDLLDELSQGDIEEFYSSGKIPGWSTASGMRHYNDIPDDRLTLSEDTTFTSYGSSDKNLDGPLWTTWKDDAKSTYRNFGDTRYELSPKREFKVASMKDAYDTFTDMFAEENDDGLAFRSSVYERRLGPLGKDRAAAYASASSKYPEAAAADCYRSFVHNQYRQTDATTSFFKRMNANGFDGILDQNDISDYTKQSPVIVLNPSESLELKNSVEHSSDAMLSMTTNAIGYEDHLSHYGVKGMKWGVWNEETRKKYSGGLGRASNAMKGKLSSAGSSVSSGARAAKNYVGAKVSGVINAKKAKREERRQIKAELTSQRKELGMTRRDYEKLREKTLKSHDPRVIEKGMHTLTDAELNEKINRLEREERISKMATSLATREANERKARSEAFNNNLVVKMGKAYVDKYVNGKIDQVLRSKDLRDQIEKVKKEYENKFEDMERSNRGLRSKLDEAESRANARANNAPFSQYTQNPFYYSSNGSSGSSGGGSRPSSSSGSNGSSGSSGRAPRGFPGATAASQQASSSGARASADRGRTYVDSDVADVKPSAASSKVSSGKKWYDLEGKNVIDNDDIPSPKKKKKKDQDEN